MLGCRVCVCVRGGVQCRAKGRGKSPSKRKDPHDVAIALAVLTTALAIYAG